jgi:hypothetical protein
MSLATLYCFRFVFPVVGGIDLDARQHTLSGIFWLCLPELKQQSDLARIYRADIVCNLLFLPG